MKQSRSLKQRLISSVLVLVMLFSSLLGTTFAWFSDTVTSEGNTIQSGNLKIDLLHKTDDDWISIKDNPDHKVFDYDKWEPGYTRIETLKIANLGSLALKYRLSVETADGTAVIGKNGESLADVIDVYVTYSDSTETDYSDITSSSDWVRKGTLSEVLKNPASFVVGNLLPTGKVLDGTEDSTTKVGSQIVKIALHMQESAGNEYQKLSVGDIYVNLVATQWSYENDSFGNDYDADVVFPELNIGGITVDVTTENNLVTQEASVSGEGVMATIPAGVAVDAGVSKLGLSVTEKAQSDANLTLNDGEALRSLDVHMSGIAASNTVPMLITIEKAMKIGLNIGNYTLYHVENGVSNAMTAVNSLSELDAHNEFYYDPSTGNVTLAMATFSEVAMVAENENAWEGKFDYTWYDASKTELTIANADQLAAFGAIVGGMAEGIERDSFTGKTVKLIADINLGDKNDASANIFHPIGYYNESGSYEKGTASYASVKSFEGIFDGNGNKISNFYQNTWQILGNYDGNHYKAAMGLFGYVYSGTVKNLTVDSFSSDGEFTPTGVIAAYAAGNATFENIAIANCNPRVYNTGNGGIIGIAGDTSAANDDHIALKNITVDNSNKISALWGSWDVACGGLVGMYRGNVDGSGNATGDTISFENCHVAAQIDVNNDVCANYQYYAYRYSGMIIGSVRHNTTNDEGRSIPNMTGISASGCTVHFGTWNDYYYCELVDNTTASYTHDYQMSRLVEIKAIDGTTITYLDGTTGTVPASGRANYVIVDYSKGHGTENATCYHFNNGEVWTHDMGGIQTGIDENGDGQDDLKEDKQHLYLEFNNLFTGYGWGVSSMAINKWNGITALDVEEGDHEESVNKFNPVDNLDTNIATESTLTIGEIFAAIENAGVDIKSDNVQVTVSPFGATSTAGGTYVANTTDWTKGTLTFSGMGQAVITITDYYFCKTTTVTVNIVGAEKFDTNFVNYNEYLYRVGNAENSTVALGTIFKHSGKGTIHSANTEVTFATIAGNASGTYTANTSDWTKGTIQFTGTGVVKVTIKDDSSKEFVLNLEVVDAVNATSATSATSNNIVLLNDCNFSSLEVSGGYTLYGNGFTMTCSSDSAAANTGYEFVTLNSGTLDNVQIVCPNFDYAVLYSSNMTAAGNRSETTDKTRYFNVKSGVEASGNSQILNSRISGARAAVNIVGGNCLIDNSRLEGGAVASLLVGAANSVTLRDVTLVQKPTASTYDSNKKLMGFSILVMCLQGGVSAPITFEGTLVQNAWVDENDAQYVPEDAKDIISTVLTKTDYLHDIDGDGTNESLNLGIAYMPAEGETYVLDPVLQNKITDTRTDKAVVLYESVEVKFSLVTTYVYSYKNTNGTSDAFKNESEYNPNKQGDIITVSYSDTAEGLTTGKSLGTDGWVYELNVDLDKVSEYKLDFSKLSLIVNGITVTDFKVNGSAKPASPVAVTAGGVTYTLTATVNGKEYTATFKVTGTETSKDSPSKITGPTTAGFGVAKSYGSDWSIAADVLTGIKVKYWSVAEKKYVEFDFSDFTVPGSAGKLNDTNSYWEYTHTNNDFTLKVTNIKAIHDSKSVYGMPILGTDGKLYFTISSTNGYVGNGTTSRSMTMQYEFTDNNGGETLTFTYEFSTSYDKSNQYSYSDLANSGKLTKLNSCVTPDTLVTLADGTQKRIDQVTYDDQLLVWDFYNGKYTISPVGAIVSHGYNNVNKLTLNFANGSAINTIGGHGFFDVSENKFVIIDETNVTNYVGHEFVAYDSNGNSVITVLETYNVETIYTEVLTIVSAVHFNCILEGMLTLSPTDFENSPAYLMPFEIGEGMKYDEEKMQADIETYGLYTYDDFAEYCTYEQFVGMSFANWKVAVGKGYITFDDIVYLIENYLN